jgi:hypothetical protein
LIGAGAAARARPVSFAPMVGAGLWLKAFRNQ